MLGRYYQEKLQKKVDEALPELDEESRKTLMDELEDVISGFGGERYDEGYDAGKEAAQDEQE